MGFISSILSTVFGTLFGSVKSALITVALILIVLCGWYVHSLNSDISELTKNNGILTQNNATLKNNVDIVKGNLKTVTESNDTNINTIKKLKDERSESEKSILKLSTTMKNDKIAIGVLSTHINELMKNPLNDGELAPVLKDTMRSIQDNRKN